jgi:hypothetical protein
VNLNQSDRHLKSVVGGALALLLLWPSAVFAHSFGTVYSLPLPFWLYGWAASAALLASFGVVAYLVRYGEAQAQPWSRDISQSTALVWSRRLYLPNIARLLSVASLLLCIATGLLGTKSPYGNFNMTFFWIIVMVGFAYLSALVGNIFTLINPYKVLCQWFQCLLPGYGRNTFSYSPQLAYWPALVFYFVFITIELFANSGPYLLAVMLISYGLINFVGVAFFGLKNWFHYADFLSVFFRLIALMAPVNYVPAERGVAGEGRVHGVVKLRMPFSGLLSGTAEHFSLLVFVLFMLAATAFDGLHETLVWKQLFWRDMYLGFLQNYTDPNPFAAFRAMGDLYRYWQHLWLLLLPLLYLAIFMAVMALSKLLMRTSLPVSQLALQMCYSLLPIALVYHIAHYFTLLETQGIKIISLASDPFAWGHNWFGTAKWLQRVFIPDVTLTWYIQLAAIITGHIISVYIAHCVALRFADKGRRVIVSQLPMLMLMMAFTASGLWILSRPVGGG